MSRADTRVDRKALENADNSVVCGVAEAQSADTIITTSLLSGIVERYIVFK